MDTLHTDLARLLAETLSQEPGLRFARLFGSRADSRTRPDSDADLAVLLTPEAVGTGCGPALRRLEEVLYERFPGLIFRMVDLATAPPLLQVEIMTHGMTLVPGRAGLELFSQTEKSHSTLGSRPRRSGGRIASQGAQAVLRRSANLRAASGEARRPGRTVGELMVRVEVVERKLEALADYLAELRALRPADLREYQPDLTRGRAIERLLQLVVEVATDINTHLAAESGQVPDNYFQSFWSVARLGAIDEDLARALAPSAGLRDRLVHQYEALDDGQVFASIHMALGLFPVYTREILAFLERR